MHTIFHSNRTTVFVFSFIVLFGATTIPLLSASCRAAQHADSEAARLARLREIGRGQLSPATELEVARIEAQAANSKAGGLARLLRARIKASAGDYSGAVGLLDAGDALRRQLAIGDRWLFMRAGWLEQLGRYVEARAAYEQLAHDYPTSLLVRQSTLRGAALAQRDGRGAAAVPVLVKQLVDADDPAALLLAARAYEQQGQSTQALAAYRRLYFYAPASTESIEAAAALPRLGSTASPATAEEATARADKLFAAKRYADAADAYRESVVRFPASNDPAMQLRRGIAATNTGRTADAIAALTALRSSAEPIATEALYHLTLLFARTRQWPGARATADDMRRLYPNSLWTARALVAAGQEAKTTKNAAEMFNFFRTAVSLFPRSAEVAGAQFELAWAAHEAKNFTESSRLLLEHLADYADKNTDNRGRAGYWAARDTERAGKRAEAAALYEAMQQRYAANWYGYLAKQRLQAMINTLSATTQFAPESQIGRVIRNLSTVTVAEETAGPAEDERLIKAEQLSSIGLDDEAFEELNKASERMPNSPRVNLALAQLYRLRTDNLQAFNTLRRSFPDYAQMEPEEMTREEWDVFYPLAYWPIITEEARAKRLDPYMVAGLIRQESVFDPRARSSANAYGLMQLLVPTGQVVARRYNVPRTITANALFDPALNIKLGTAYMRDQFDDFGRIEYVAAAYNAGPGRAVRWRTELPAEIDEWAEAVPFRETRGYVQGVVRNMLQYKRLYDERGQFRLEVGTRAVHSAPSPSENESSQPAPSSEQTVRPRRITGGEDEQ